MIGWLTRLTGWRRERWCPTITQWREDWSSASVVNHTIVTVTIRQPGFDLPRYTWSLLNRFRTDQGPCRANLHKWGLPQSPSCYCGQRQTMSHIVDMCPLTKFEGGLNLLHEVDDDAVIWLEATVTAALAKWNEFIDCLVIQWFGSRRILSTSNLSLFSD